MKYNTHSWNIKCDIAKRWFVFYILFFALASCQQNETLFQRLEESETGVTFANTVQETEQENILNYEYFYNGGGVAAGDFNNDGLTDLYFTGNQVENKLYLNKGKESPLKFEDITQKAGVAGRTNAWKTGVTLVDINADGWMDIYVCYSGQREEAYRRNQLFINKHDLTFSEEAQAYGLDDAGYSTQATFFDYDLDGDLDCFLINHNLAGYQRKEAAVMRATRDANAGDKLFRNDSDTQNGNFQPKFTDVSEQEGIKGNPLGFGLGVVVSDVNNDGYPDIYVTNDYVEDDYLYINQKTGSPRFKDELRERVAHTSYSAMGVDIADVNNDGLSDIFTLDMLPEDNARQKLLLWPDSWNTYQAQLSNGFWHANMRNMLQLNQGNGQFAEIGQLAGVSNTDWSWGTLLADFDSDGYKDIFVSNGLGKDYTNADFIKYFNDEEAIGSRKSLLEHLKQMPTSQTKNYIFKNNRDLTFSNEQTAWGFDEPTVASGAVYADLDNDGDLEIITNNLNEPAHIYQNKTQENNPETQFVKVKLQGTTNNPWAIGAKVTVKVAAQDTTFTITQEVAASRGFQSSMLESLTIGLGTGKVVSVRVDWNDATHKVSMICPKENQKAVVVSFLGANTCAIAPVDSISKGLFTEVISSDLLYQLPEVNNFNRQVMLPTHYSYTGPKIAVGDLNMDGKEDAVVCGTKEKPATILLQTIRGFEQKALHVGSSLAMNQDAIIADFNGDKYPDIYLANGSYANAQSVEQQDELWLNNGKGVFSKALLPDDATNTLCVKAVDFDKDGDMDIFVGGHVAANRFPIAEDSYWLRNDGKAIFSKVPIGKLGLVTDAVIMDVNHDGFDDVVVVGEWMKPVLLTNTKHFTFTKTNLDLPAGLYYRIEKGDLDQDGDDDLVLGNMGKNTQMRASEAEPASLIYDDFDQNGTVDFFLNYFIQGKSYPACTRDEVGEQLPMLRKKLVNYQVYSQATMEDLFDGNTLGKASKLEVTNLNTMILENDKGNFVSHSLPIQAQFAPVYAIVLRDVNHDGKKDLFLAGNNSKLRLRLGKVDANTGLVLINKGNFHFTTLTPQQVGFYLRGDVRDAKQIGSYLLVGVNNEKLRIFK